MNRQQAFLLALVVVSGALSLLVLLPFLQYVLAAVLLGYVLRPIHRRAEPYLGERLAAITVISGTVVTLLLPLAYLGLVIYRDIRALAAGDTALNLDRVARRIEMLTGQTYDLQGAVNELGKTLFDVLFGNASEVFSYATRLLLGGTLVLFLLYYVLRDGPAFVQWAVEVAPLDEAVTRHLLASIDRTTWGVVVGHILVAVLQGVVGGFGLFLAGIPNYAFWTFVMIVLALLPLIGAFLVWGPATGYLWAVGQPEWALFMFLWGGVVVSLVDNYARPILIDQRAHVNPGLILIGVFGGVYVIGSIGLFVGPIVVGLFAATLQAFHDHYDALSDATPPPQPPDQTHFPWLGGGSTNQGVEPDPREESTASDATEDAPDAPAEPLGDDEPPADPG